MPKLYKRMVTVKIIALLYNASMSHSVSRVAMRALACWRMMDDDGQQMSTRPINITGSSELYFDSFNLINHLGIDVYST